MSHNGPLVKPDSLPGRLRHRHRNGLEEVVLCSGQGEVLYEWQSPDTNYRVDFLEFLTRKSWQIGLGLPLGPFERLEVQGAQSRLVTRLGVGSGLLVRCNNSPSTPPP